MRTSLNPLMYKEFSYSRLFETAGIYELLLSPGTYYVAMSGGGGAGGSIGKNIGIAGGNAGAGGKGDVVTQTIVLDTSTRATVYVGAGGLTKANGGNGGNGGTQGIRETAGTTGGDSVNGCGGGGGFPTYISIYSGTLVYANGGGGGGGGGSGSSGTGRYSSPGGGGGGGGFYRLNTDTLEITSIPGKPGGGGGGANNELPGPGAGQDGNTDYLEIYSGAGGDGNNSGGGAGASGGGASGGGGGRSSGNNSYAIGGGGGGGAGGSIDAGGGAGGYNGGTAYNHHSSPTTAYNNFGQVTNLGRGGYGQTSQQNATNGYNGWFYIIKIQNSTPWDMGTISEPATQTFDCEQVNEPVEQLLEMGNIA